jgi:hypothetical protein
MTSHIQLRKVKDNETDSLVNYNVNYHLEFIEYMENHLASHID